MGCEHKYWGDGQSNPIADPNPRLQRLIKAARRNRATVDYVRAIAAAEGLDLDARLGNPTGGGIHAKIVLIRVGGETWSVVGSLNGGEISHKINREVLMFNVQVVLPALPSCLRGIGNKATSAIAAPLLQ